MTNEGRERREEGERREKEGRGEGACPIDEKQSFPRPGFLLHKIREGTAEKSVLNDCRKLVGMVQTRRGVVVRYRQGQRRPGK